jgi:D-amino-acid oxidase
MSSTVVVLGGGVTGLTTALALLKRGVCGVEVWRASRGMAPPNWIWEYPPFAVEPAEKALRWAANTLAELHAAATEPDSGVFVIPLVNLLREPLQAPGDDRADVYTRHGGRYLTGEEALAEAKRLVWPELAARPAAFVDAEVCDVPVCDSARYLAWLQRRVEALGGVFKTVSVESVAHAVELMRDQPAAAPSAVGGGGAPTRSVLVNCTGLAAREATPDAACYPCRGQLLHVDAPWLQCAVFDDGMYAIPVGATSVKQSCTAPCVHRPMRATPAALQRPPTAVAAVPRAQSTVCVEQGLGADVSV